MTCSKFKIHNQKSFPPRSSHLTAKPGFFLAQVVGESMNRRISNGWAGPRNLTFAPASPKAADPEGLHSDGRNVEMRHLTPFVTPFNDSHAEDIVDIVRKEFGKGNDF